MVGVLEACSLERMSRGPDCWNQQARVLLTVPRSRCLAKPGLGTLGADASEVKAFYFCLAAAEKSEPGGPGLDTKILHPCSEV